MKSKQHVIDHPTQLNSLSVLPILRTRALGTLRLGGGIAEHPKAQEWEAELNRHYYACGCDVGAKGLLIGLAAGGLWGLLGRETTWGGIGLALGGAVAGAVVGKALGLLRARARMRSVIAEIQKSWKVEPPAEPVPVWTCG